MKQPLTYERINRLIARRERLTNRRDEHLNIPAINEIDATLRDVPPGQRADVDKLLGRYCAVHQSKWTKEKMDAVADRFAQIFVEQVEKLGGKATIVTEQQPAPVATDEQTTDRAAAIVDALERAAAETGVKAEWLSKKEIAQLETIDDGRRDWNDIKGDCDN